LNDLKVNLQIYAVITSVTVSAPDIELVNLGDYPISSSSINLISYDPNYFVLYTELEKSYSELASQLQEIRQSLTTLTQEINDLKTTLTNEISLLDSKIKMHATKLNNLTAEYGELQNSLTSVAQRVASLESQVNQLITQPRELQFYINILYGILITVLIAVVSALVLSFKKLKRS